MDLNFDIWGGLTSPFFINIIKHKNRAMSIFNLYEMYNAVYDEELRDEIDDLTEDFAGVEDLTDEELDSIVEEAIYDVLNEGFDVEELDVIFEEVLLEAKVTMGRGGEAGASDKVTSGSGSRIAAASRLSAARTKKRQERIAKVKGAIKKGVEKVKSAPGEAKKSAEKKIKDVKQQSHVAAAKYASSRNLVKGAGLKTQSSKGRSELRSAVAKDIKSRVGAKIKAAASKVKQKAASAAVSGYAAARSAKQAASDVKNKAVQSVKNKAAVAKRGAKSAVGKAARAVSTGAGKVASRLGEEIDLYDVVLNHLLENNYAETEEAATAIMANMSEDWKQDIIDSIED